MKLFYFNPNNYGEEAFVAAETKEQAIEALKATKPDVSELNDEETKQWHTEYHREKIDKMVNCKEGYTIDEFPVGHVVFTEIS